jgi:hypothetical protein
MPYTHTVVAHPSLTSDQLKLRQGWDQLQFVGEIRTDQSATFVFESENMIGLAALNMLACAPEVWNFYGNCDAQSRRPQSSSL